MIRFNDEMNMFVTLHAHINASIIGFMFYSGTEITEAEYFSIFNKNSFPSGSSIITELIVNSPDRLHLGQQNYYVDPGGTKLYDRSNPNVVVFDFPKLADSSKYNVHHNDGVAEHFIMMFMNSSKATNIYSGTYHPELCVFGSCGDIGSGAELEMSDRNIVSGFKANMGRLKLDHNPYIRMD